jgi:cytochrome P450
MLREPWKFINDLVEDYGDYVHYRGLIHFYLINDPALIKKVFSETHRNYNKQTIIYDRFRRAFGHGLVTAEGTHWKRQRKLLQPAFSPASIEKFFSYVLSSSQQMITRWAPYAEKQQIFNLADEMSLITLEMTGRTLFSDNFSDSSEAILRWSRVMNRFSSKPPIPFLSDYRLPLPVNLALQKALKEYRKFMQETVVERRHSEPKPDLLSIFLALRDEETGEPMSEEEIAEEILAIIVGGHETTSATLTWVFHELHHHPEVLISLIEEIERVSNGSPLQYDQISELSYAKMVIQETMRLYPPFWFENRNTVNDVELGGQKIPKNSLITLSRYALHRNPKYWPNPDCFDPQRFHPDRIDGADHPQTRGTYLPFSSGPRICIGRHLAMMEITVVLCTILQHFHVMVDPDHDDSLSVNMTMELKSGLPVSICKCN